MSVLSVGQQLADYCRRLAFLDAIDALYASNVVTVEPFETPECSGVTEGFDAVRAGSVQWLGQHEVHRCDVEGPFAGRGQFAVSLTMDVTIKAAGQRVPMTEIGLYTVVDDKITHAEFFYTMPEQQAG